MYERSIYYQERDDGGVGYDAYELERAYREAKGRRLVEWISSRSERPPRSLLEVGSGFGFTLSAARSMGLVTCGIDVNPYAAAAAERLYGFDTFVGTLGEARARAELRLSSESWDVVLYQFVLEHLADPAQELREVAALVAPGASLCVVVPSMSAVEVEVFGASYRSFRSDHLHLFSRRSIERYLASAGFALVAAKTTCSLHLFRGFLTAQEMEALYAEECGPDWYVLARRLSQ